MMFGHYSAPTHPTPGCAYVARIDFEHGLHTFKSGQDFDWRALGLVESQAVALWVAGHLFVKEPKPAAPAQPQQKRR